MTFWGKLGNNLWNSNRNKIANKSVLIWHLLVCVPQYIFCLQFWEVLSLDMEFWVDRFFFFQPFRIPLIALGPIIFDGISAVIWIYCFSVWNMPFLFNFCQHFFILFCFYKLLWTYSGGYLFCLWFAEVESFISFYQIGEYFPPLFLPIFFSYILFSIYPGVYLCYNFR